MRIFNGQDSEVAIASKNHSLSFQDLSQICSSQNNRFNKNRVYALVMHNDIVSALIYICLLNCDCTFVIVDPALMESNWSFINDLNIVDILSSKEIKKEQINVFNKNNISTYNLSFLEYKKENPLRNPNNIISKPSILLNTSGSSGKAKLVRLTYNNVISNTEAIIYSLRLNNKDSSISTLPFFYTYGLSILNTHLYSGGTLYVTDNSIITKDFIKELEDFRPTTISGVPSTYEIMKKLDYIHLKNNHIKKITQAGGRLNNKIQQDIINLCKNRKSFFIMYGQTEATARISCFDVTKNPKKIGSVGKALSNVNLEINKIQKESSIGEIVVSGPSITPGYVNSLLDILKPISHRFLRTGDLGYIDNEGFIYITGRTSRFCKINGKRLNLDLLENQFALEEYAPIYIVSDDKNIFIFSIKHINKRNISISGVHPSIIKLNKLNSIPLKANGKVDYNNLLELATIRNI